MRQAFADGDGPCRRSLRPHHAIRPAQPNSRQSHFFVFEAPFESTRLVFPKGAPPSIMEALLAFIHFIQTSIPFFRCSGVEFFIIFSNSAPAAMYSTMNFFIGSSLCSAVDQLTNLTPFLGAPKFTAWSRVERLLW